jgi:hypothetical protein
MKLFDNLSSPTAGFAPENLLPGEPGQALIQAHTHSGILDTPGLARALVQLAGGDTGQLHALLSALNPHLSAADQGHLEREVNALPPLAMTISGATAAAGALPEATPALSRLGQIGAGMAEGALGAAGRLAGPLGIVLGVITPDNTQQLSAPVAPDLRAVWAPGDLSVRFQKRVDGEWRDLGVTGQLDNGAAIRVDTQALETAYGHALPDPPGVPLLAPMARRPEGVNNRALQTTSDSARTAMAQAPDPCKNLPGQNHHIVPAQLMKRNEDFFTQIGFRLDDPANMVRLPRDPAEQADMAQLCGETRPTHNGPHDKYAEAVNEKIDGIKEQLEEGKISPAEAQAKVQALMSEIRSAIASGRFGGSLNDAALAAHIRSLGL